MAQHFNGSTDRGNIAPTPASPQAVVERLEARQLLSGSTGAETMALLDVSHATTLQAHLTGKASTVAPQAVKTGREVRIEREIANFTTHIRREVARHPGDANSATFQQHIAKEQAKFARQIARKGGTFTPIPFSALLAGASAHSISSAVARAVGSGFSGITPSVIVANVVTPPLAAPVLTGKAASATSITLTWTAITGATTYKLETSTNGGLSWTTLTNASVLTFTQTGLAADTAHSYRISTIKTGKESVPSSTVVATTFLPAPAGVTGTTKSVTEIDLTWIKVTDATSYKIERSLDGNTFTALAPTTPLTGTSVSYADTTALAGTLYYYRVSAVNTVGTSVASSVVHATTLPSSLVLKATVASTTEVDLSWASVTGATAYKLESSKDGGATWSTLASAGATTFANTALTANTAYSYRVSAIDAGGSSAPSTVVPATTLLVAPTGVTASAASTTEIDLTWSAVLGATSYKIERSPTGTAWTALVPTSPLTATSISYADTSATTGATFYYRISAIDAAGTSVPSSVVHALTYPSAPTVTLASKSATEIDLSWTTAIGATSYSIQSSADGGNTWTTLATQATTTYANTALSADIAYKYRVTAIDATGNSAASTVVTASTYLAAPTGLAATVASATEIDLAWNVVADATSYKIERSPDGTAWTALAPATPFTGTSATYANTGLTAGNTYYYRISAINAVGTSVPSSSIHALTVPAAPVLTPTVASLTQVNLSWTAPTGATSYKLETSTDGGSTWSTLATQSTTTYANTNLAADSTYKYRVSAIDATGSSVTSAVASALTLPQPPAGLASTAVSPTEIDLAWTAEIDATSYKIERSPDGTAWTALVPSTPLVSSSASFADTGLTAGTTYYYRISANGPSGTSTPATAVHALTYPAAAVLSGKVVSATEIDLSWVAVKSATAYKVESSTDGFTWTTASTPTAVTYNNTALNSDSTYFYRVSAINPTGTSAASNVYTNTTVLPAPTGVAVSAAAATEIDVTWTAVPDATSYKIERSPDGTAWTALTPTTPLTSSSIRFADTSVTAGGTYYYRVSAIDASGTSVASTAAHTQTVPAAPTLTAVVFSATQINLSWTASTNATSYTLQKSTDGGSTWTTAVTQTTTTYSDTSLSADTALKYRVAANDATGASLYSAVASGTTQENPPTGLATTAHSATEIDLTWNSVTDATSYKIERSPTGATWTALVPATPLNSSSTSFADTSVAAGLTYYYRISATSASGTSVPSSAVHLMTPPAATTLTAVLMSASVVNLSWTASTSATSYVVTVSNDGGTTWTQAALPTGTTFAATGLTSDTLYKFKVTAINAGGASAASNTASVTTLLAAPAGFSATAHSTTEVDLAWTAVTDATTYKVERSIDNVTWAALTPSTPLVAASSAYADTGVSAGTTYYYRISAVDTAGSSAPTAIIPSLTYSAAATLAATPVSPTSIKLSWAAVTGASSYLLESSPDGTNWTTVVTQAGTSYINTGLNADTSYQYRLTAINSTGNSAVSNIVTISTILTAPTGFTATVASATEVDLAWATVTDATNYTVQRSLNGTVWTTLAPNPALNSSSTSYADTTALAGTTYYYSVAAIDAAGGSPGATTVTVLTVPAAPTLTGTPASGTQVNLSWTATKSATSYKLESSPDGTNWTTVITQAGTTYANTGLTADTAYQYRVTAINASGNSAASSTATITTLLAAPSALTATAVSATEIDIAWTAEADATNYIIQRSTNGTVWRTLTPSTPLTSTSSSYADTSVLAGTTYYYSITGVNALGNSAPATTASALTVPGTPTLAATVASATQVNLTWSALKGATGYKLESSPDGTNWTTVITQAGTTYANTGLTADTAYQYRVTANDATGGGTASSTVTVTTLQAAPIGFTATAASATEIDLAWTAAADATNYKMERSLNQTIWTTIVPSTPLTSSSTSYADTSVSAGTTYYYRLSAITAIGTSAPTTAASALTVPGSPTLTANVASATQVNLTWTPAKGATSYKLESSPDGTNWTTVITQAGTTYANTGLTADTAYQYRVTANDATGGGTASSTATVSTLLAAPSAFTATAASATEIDLAWTAEADATGYTIQRSLNGTVWTTLVPSTPLTSTSSSYADTTVLAGTTYYYSILGVDAAGSSAPATTASAMTVTGTPTLTATVTSATQVNLTWTAAKGATSYKLESSPDGTNWTTVITQAGTTYANTALTADTSYQYRVSGNDAGGAGAASSTATVTTLLAAPTGFTATAASATEIDLAWTAIADATNFTIQKSINGTVWTTIVPSTPLTSSSTSYADTAVLAGTVYYYSLVAIDAAGTSAPATTVHTLTISASPTLSASVNSATQVNLNWTPSLGATSYLVESSPDGTNWTTVITQAGTSYVNTALTADTLYEYRVTAINGSGSSTASSTVTVTTLLAAPSAFTVTGASSTENDLAWTAETDATNYKIERSVNQAIWTTLVPSTPLTSTSSSYADTAVAPGTTYYYRISGIDVAGTSVPTTVATILSLPDTPVLTATPQLGTEIDLSWTPVASATSYKLESSPDGTNWTTLATQAGTTYANTGLTADTAYQYRITAINATGNSAVSSVVNATTLLGAPTGFGATAASNAEVDLTWTAVADATTYQIEVSTDQQAWLALSPGTPLVQASTSFHDTTVLAGTTYYYRIEAINALGISVPSTAVTVIVPLAAPAGLTATAASASQINLAWTADTDAGLTGFTLQSSADNSAWSDVETIAPASTSASDIRLTAATLYYYRLIAVSAGGNSTPSNVAHATTTA